MFQGQFTPEPPFAWIPGLERKFVSVKIKEGTDIAKDKETKNGDSEKLLLAQR